MSEKRVKIAVQGADRWDLVAHRMYGDPFAYEGLIRANPALLITGVLPSGAVVSVPIPEAAPAVLSSELLPPWLRPL